ncbi:MAG: hypothetical protein QXD79_07440 [Candidatus Methanomethylicia archaeon]
MLDDLFYKDIMNCRRCEFSQREPKHYNSKPEWNLPPQFQFWAKNKFPCKKDVYYTMYQLNPTRWVEPNVVFVSLRPSTGHIPSISDIIFANALIKHGLAKERFNMDGDRFVYYETYVLVTDLICCRGPAKEMVEARHVEACIGHFIKQLEILKEYYGKIPKIIAIGKSITEPKLKLESVKKYLQEVGTKVIGTVPHYGRQKNPEEYIKKFDEALNKNRITFKSVDFGHLRNIT